MDLCSTASLSLKLYVTIWSAENIEEISSPRFIDINKLDQTYFQEYITTYNTEIKSMRHMLFKKSAEYEPNLFEREIISTDATALMLSKLISSNRV